MKGSINGVDVCAEWRELLRQPIAKPFQNHAKLVNIRRGHKRPRTTSGHCFAGSQVTVTIGVQCDRAAIIALLAHELSHVLAWDIPKAHGPEFWTANVELLRERFNCSREEIPPVWTGRMWVKYMTLENRIRELIERETA